MWSPWRFRYVTSLGREKGCILCLLQSGDEDREKLILLRAQHSFLALNKFPYSTGHLMIATQRHVPTLREASPEELNEMIRLAGDCEGALQDAYNPDGFNIGFNVGRAAGAGVAGHLHLHVVPRWEGDTSFISVIGETRVMPEDLGTTYDKLYPYFHPE